MDFSIYHVDSLTNEKIAEFITERKSFKLEGMSRRLFGDTVDMLEKMIEAHGLRCRIYTAGRVASIVLAPISIPYLATHNLVTFNPDYEICKRYVDLIIEVEYKK